MNSDQSNRRERRGRRGSEELDELTEAIIGSAIEVHRALGPGLLESTYEMCLCRELSIRGLQFERQVPIPVEYKGLINFNVELLKHGLRRRVLGLVEDLGL
nr:hypothetical protein Hi04_10k_c2476_00022 [uncultured bacterium]